MDMVVHRFNDHIREDLTRIGELMALTAKNSSSEKEGSTGARLATAP